MTESLALYTPPTFESYLLKHQIPETRSKLDILQVNNGKKCNLACLHCHVEAGPNRTELMGRKTTDRILDLLKETDSIHTVDITGGSPEMNPDFKYFVTECRKLGKTCIDRCNPTIFFEKGYEDIPEFLAEQEMYVIASLPCYTADNVDKQRGRGVFGKSIDGLLRLNELGYGQADTGLKLDLVYNPLGASLPPSQQKLEKDYKVRLKEDFGIVFNNLLTITNMPIKRFLHQLERDGKYESYMELLVSKFNPHVAGDIMCRNLISVSWQGELFDCDFNQMLELPAGGETKTVWHITHFNELIEQKIAFKSHCFGCTAGAGSSCSGALG